MYFPSLENLKKHDPQISDYEVKTFDSWLGTRPEYTWEYLNPLQFSIDLSFSDERSMNLFLASTHYKDVDLFRVRFVYKCPTCSSPLIVELDNPINNLEGKYCEDCEKNISAFMLKEMATVFFSLQKEPVPPNSAPLPNGTDERLGEKANHLRAKQFMMAKDNFMSRFLTDF
ncbi:hypothetical protein ABZ756_00485 [Mammaliicoccus sciuri]